MVDAAPGGGVTLETIPAGELPENAEAPDGGIETAEVPFATAGDA